MKKPLLIVGPLPPPFGGARVSFAMFFDYLRRTGEGQEILHFDLPIRKSRESVAAGPVDHIRSQRGVLRAAGHLAGVRRLIIFGSKNFCFSYGLQLLLVSKLTRTPVSVRFFGGHPAGTFKLKEPFRSIAMRLLGLAERIVVETEVAVSEFPEFLHDKLEVVHAYRLAQRGSRPDRDEDRRAIRFIYVGHVTAEKGIPTLASAVSSVQKDTNMAEKIEVHVYGSGDPEVISQLETVPGIHYHGRIPQEQLVREIPSYDVMLFPSVYENEGHPGAVVEGLMAGLPIIASDLAGPLEILKHGDNALIVKAGDERSLSAAIKRISSDPDLRSKLADGALVSGGKFDAELVLPKLSASLGTIDQSPGQ